MASTRHFSVVSIFALTLSLSAASASTFAVAATETTLSTASKLRRNTFIYSLLKTTLIMAFTASGVLKLQHIVFFKTGI